MDTGVSQRRQVLVRCRVGMGGSLPGGAICGEGGGGQRILRALGSREPRWVGASGCGVRRCPGFGPGAAGGLGSTQSAWTHLPVDVLWSPETVCLVV